MAEAYGILFPGFLLSMFIAEGPDLIEPQAEEIEEIAKSKLEQAFPDNGYRTENEVLVEDSGPSSIPRFPPYSSFVRDNWIVRIKSDVGRQTGCRIQGRCSSPYKGNNDMHGDMQGFVSEKFLVILASDTTLFSSRMKQ